MSNERIEAFYRDATAADVLRVMKGEEVEARFSDNRTAFFNSSIAGWRSLRNDYTGWVDKDGSHWTYCQVYEPPQWYVDKPEPGEGYRLLGKFPDEDLQPGDAFFENNQWWPVFLESPYPQVRDVWYRRRIEQPKPEPKFAVGQRVKIVGPKARPAECWERAMDEHVGETGLVTGLEFLSAGVLYQVGYASGWNFREDYLESVVEPEPKHYKLNVGDTADVPSGHRIKALADGIEVQ